MVSEQRSDLFLLFLRWLFFTDWLILLRYFFMKKDLAERIILKDWLQIQFFLSQQLHYSTHAKTNQARSNEFKADFKTILIIDGI